MLVFCSSGKKYYNGKLIQFSKNTSVYQFQFWPWYIFIPQINFLGIVTYVLIGMLAPTGFTEFYLQSEVPSCWLLPLLRSTSSLWSVRSHSTAIRAQTLIQPPQHPASTTCHTPLLFSCLFQKGFWYNYNKVVTTEAAQMDFCLKNVLDKDGSFLLIP